MNNIKNIVNTALTEYSSKYRIPVFELPNKLNKSRVPLFIIIPAYNEEANISRVLKELHNLALPVPYRIIIIDDGSSDATKSIAQKYQAFVISLPKNRGGGYAIYVGYQFAIASNVKYVITMDADGQHQAKDMKNILNPVVDKISDVVIGSRKKGKTSDKQLWRNIGISFFNVIITLLVRQKITDCTNSYRAISIDVLKKIKPPINLKHHTAEFIVQCALNKFSILETPIHILPRYSGESKKGHSLVYALSFANSIFSSWFKFSKEIK